MNSMINDNQTCNRRWAVTLASGGAGLTLQIDAGSPAELHAGLRAFGEVGRAVATQPSPPPQVEAALPMTAVGATNVAPPAAVGVETVPQPSVGASAMSPDAEPWDALIAKWVGAEGAAWAPKTVLDYRMAAARFARFAEQNGVHGLDQVTAQLVDSYKRHLNSKFKIVPRTSNKHLAALASLFHWGKTAGYCHQAQSPFAGQAYARKKVRKTSVKRFGFTEQDLAKIFDPANVRKLKKPHEFWCLFLAFRQAIRIGEAAQIWTSDFMDVDGTWVLYIRAHKTEATERHVPVHPDLIGLGILDYIADVRRILGKDGMLFPFLRFDSANGYGDVPSEALGRYLRRLELPHQERKVLHCARKTLNNQLKQRGVTEEHRCAYLGHAYESVNSVDYADPMAAVALGKIVLPHLQSTLDIEALRMRPGQFDGVLKRELRRRKGLDAHKAAKDGTDGRKPAQPKNVSTVTTGEQTPRRPSATPRATDGDGSG